MFFKFVYPCFDPLDCKTVRNLCASKHARQKVWSEAENREGDWGETLKIRIERFAYVILACEQALHLLLFRSNQWGRVFVYTGGASHARRLFDWLRERISGACYCLHLASNLVVKAASGNSKAVSSVVSLCNVVFSGRSKMSGSSSTLTKPVPEVWQ